MKRFASLPASRLPIRSATPRISAASIVSAFNASFAVQAPGHRHRRVVGREPHVRVVAGRERELHAGLRQLAGDLIRRGMERVLAARQREDAGENHRDVLLFQQRRDEPGLGAAADDDVDLRAIGKRDGIADVLLPRHGRDEREPALDDGDERFEHQIDGFPWTRLARTPVPDRTGGRSRRAAGRDPGGRRRRSVPGLRRLPGRRRPRGRRLLRAPER